MKKQTLYMIIIALIALQLSSLLRINSLQSRIEYISHSIENRLDNQINSIYQDMDAKLEEQASLIYRSRVTLGKLDRTTLTVPIIFTIEPKSVTETMIVSLDFNGEIVQLDKSGMEYSTAKNFRISDNISPQIIIEDNGVKSIEEHRDLNVSSIKEQVFPNIFARFSGQTSYSSNKYRAKGKLDIDYKLAQEDNPFISIKYVIKVGDEIIKETPIVLEKESRLDETFTLDIDDKYAINKGEILTSNVVAVDSLGFTHEYLVTHLVADSRIQREPYFEQVKIMAPNGETVYLFDENHYRKIK